MAFEFSLQSVSKCRNLLMGYAILGVLVGHIISFGDVESFGFINAILWLSGLVHTAGFLFLSGFGVFYSLHKRECIWDFYKRRVKRFLLPFLLLALPFYVLVCYVNGYDLLQYLSYISTVEFWLHGNYHGMWYIAVSLLLYIITPPHLHPVFVVKSYRYSKGFRLGMPCFRNLLLCKVLFPILL